MPTLSQKSTARELLSVNPSLSQLEKIVSIPYTKEKGIAPIEVRKEVQYAHNAKESFSDQSRDVSTIFLKILLMFLFATSTALLVYGLYAEDL